MLAHGVAGDRPQPSPEIPAQLEIRQMHKRIHKHLLNNILRLAPVVQRQADDPQYFPLIAVHNLLVVVRISAPDAPNQFVRRQIASRL
jgi:hypothetical protein